MAVISVNRFADLRNEKLGSTVEPLGNIPDECPLQFMAEKILTLLFMDAAASGLEVTNLQSHRHNRITLYNFLGGLLATHGRFTNFEPMDPFCGGCSVPDCKPRQIFIESLDRRFIVPVIE